jgi:hypothetical protein
MSALAFQSIIVPSGPEFGVPYVLTAADGQRAVFNDEADPDYVGMLTDISGFDSPEVRENADDLVEMDGGLHGDFYYGRRPITLEGQIMHNGDPFLRNMQVAKLQRASSALREDATLIWTPSGGVQQYMNLRRQQPLRITGGFNKTFQLSMVASDPRIYSTALHSNQADTGTPSGAVAGFGFNMGFPLSFGQAIPSGQMFLVNQGNAENFPIYYVYGPGTSPAIVNMTTGTVISMLVSLGLLDVLIVDTRERTVRLAQRSGADDVVNYVLTPGFPAGLNDWAARGSVTATVGADATAPSGLGQVATVTGATVGTDPWEGLQQSGSAGDMQGLREAQDYTIQFSVKRNSATARNAVALVTWYTTAGVLVSTATGPPVATVNGSWVTYTTTVTAPTGATRAGLNLVIDNGGVAFTAGESFSFDKISMVAGSTALFGTGDTAGWMWTSTQYNSQSRQPGTEINLDTANDRYGVLDFANTQWGGLVPGSNDVRLSYFSFSTGAKIIAEYRDAWM